MALLALGTTVLLILETPEPYESYKHLTHIVTPDKYRHGPEDRPVWGRIIARGMRCQVPLMVGNRVLVGKFAPYRFRYDGQEYAAVQEQDILFVDLAFRPHDPCPTCGYKRGTD